MSTSTAFKVSLAVGMLVSGTLNTILTKMQNHVCVENCDNPDPKARLYYSQPVWQTLVMFLGELMCMVLFAAIGFYKYHFTDSENTKYQQIVDQTPNEETADYHIVESVNDVSYSSISDDDLDQQIQNMKADKPELSGAKNLLLWIPTACDIIGTTLMNVGLLFTTASVYQMLRGVVVIFVGLFSVKILGHKLTRDQWVSLAMIVFGALLVGTSSVINSNDDEDTSALGHLAKITLGP
ncbi:Solute carrier family 35 member F6, partial [Smittium mucronatum]